MFDKIKIEFYGGSHEREMGAVVYGFEKGSRFSMKKILDMLQRRSPSEMSETSRKETDIPEFISGATVENGFVTVNSEKFEFIIRNSDYRDSDYDNLKDIPRPSHADYAAYMKYGRIPSGGGKFSGRMTALICVIGAMASEVLEREGIRINGEAIIDETLKDSGDSFGGIVSVTVSGVKAGALGDALFDGLEGKISYAVFGVPAVKGVEFGAGFSLAKMKGSEANDTMHFEGDKVVFDSDNMGGIDGGISNGNDIRFRAVVKPASSILKDQESINLRTGENVKISILGRHDACIVRRAVPCIESAAAIALLDELYKQKQ
ncbi:MAG: chorismate synthase [Clostridia bacterium]|nr:chorismate synthase [Clostridia bacterium]